VAVVGRPLQLGGQPQVRNAHGVQLGVQLGRRQAAFQHREGTVRVLDHMHHGPRAGGADEAVAVPLGPAVAQPHPVHHALARAPDVDDGVFEAQRVGPVAQVAAVQLGRTRLVTGRSKAVTSSVTGANGPSRYFTLPTYAEERSILAHQRKSSVVH
jgi:hypothetical protein